MQLAIDVSMMNLLDRIGLSKGKWTFGFIFLRCPVINVTPSAASLSDNA